ncbi:MAG: putative metal-binding motif-containing protein [Deltaproteobacteria bacterium]|nr:putative metal-binding motif-containing protein [Deltaproteobacteria bacterium]
MKRLVLLALFAVSLVACPEVPPGEVPVPDDDDAEDPSLLSFSYGDARESTPGALDWDVYSQSGGQQDLVEQLPWVQEDPITATDGTIYFAQQTLGGGRELFELSPDGALAQLTDDLAGPFWDNAHPALSVNEGALWFTSRRRGGGSVIRRLALATESVETLIDLGDGTSVGAPQPVDWGDGERVLFSGDAGVGDPAVYEWSPSGVVSVAGTEGNGLFDAGPWPLSDGLVVFHQESGPGACGPQTRLRFARESALDDELEPLGTSLVGYTEGRSLGLVLDGVLRGVSVRIEGGVVVADASLPLVAAGARPQLVTADRLRGQPGPDLHVRTHYATACCAEGVPCDVPLEMRPQGGAFSLEGEQLLSWSFGDGGAAFSSWTDLEHRYPAPGVYQPVAIHLDGCGERVVPGPLVVVPDCANWVDADGDGVGADTDCDDADAANATGAPEVCDGADNDCDGDVGDEDVDEDGDGLTPCDGDCDDTDPELTVGCQDADGDGVPADQDCDDSDAGVYPGQAEVCDGDDQDCDGTIEDEQYDLDADGESPCEGDCDDLNATVWTGGTEVCDHVDSDCDGDLVDGAEDLDGDGEPDCVDVDGDGDGYDSIASGGLDCDDGDAAVGPGAIEVCDGIDGDCDGALADEEADLDGDGVAACDGDCDDDDAVVVPGAAEGCDGIDTDCDGTLGADELSDGDGDGSPTCADCDDADPTRSPDLPEACDAVDNNCDGQLPTNEDDDDGDGTIDCADCDDGDPAIYPGAVEVCNLDDDDCDGMVDEGFDVDTDGWTLCEGDCDDTDINIFPGAPEGVFAGNSCSDGEDNDCQGDADCLDPSCTISTSCVPDDPWEDNDTQAAAVTIGPGVYTQGVLCWEGVGLGDWFTACVQPGGSVTAVVEHFSSAPDSLGNFVGAPAGTDNFGWTNPSSTQNGDYAWGEQQSTPSVCSWYRMTVTVTNGC